MKKISEKKIIDNGYRAVFERVFELESGGRNEFLIYGHAGNPDSVAVLARDMEGRFVLIDEYRVGPEKVVRSCVLGGHEPPQSIQESAKMELEQELGCTGGTLYYLGRRIHGPYMMGYNHLYFADNVVQTAEQQLEHGEEITPVYLSQEQLEEQILTGEISCPITTGLYYLAREKTKNFTNFTF